MKPAILIAATAVIVSCGNAYQDTYLVDIIGPTDSKNMFEGAVRATMEVGNQEVARGDIVPGRTLELYGKGITANPGSTGTILVKAFDGAGKVVAFGQTPTIELVRRSVLNLRVFVQRPGSFGRALSTRAPLRSHVAVPLEAPAGAQGLVSRMTVALFGTGREIALGPQMMQTEEPSNNLYVYSPLTHDTEFLGATPDLDQVPQFRIDASALARPDGQLVVFGGVARAGRTAAPHVTGQLDIITVRRTSLPLVSGSSFREFGRDAGRVQNNARVARSHSVLVAIDAGTILGFGGRDDSMALDSVVSIDSKADAPLDLLGVKMSAARSGHTATAVKRDGMVEVLVFGGSDPDKPLADTYVPATKEFIQPDGAPGVPRHDHAALLLSDGRVLIIGGADPDGLPLGSSVIYDPMARRFAAGPVILVTPRSSFAAFVIENDLVIAGGLGTEGILLDSAEIFDLKSLAPVAIETVFPRARASATLLSNQSVAVIGGDARDNKPTDVIEIYQPRRP